MTQQFDKRYLLRGTFKGQGFRVANCDCEVTVNPLDSSRITAKIYASGKDVGLDYLNSPLDAWRGVEFNDDVLGNPSQLRGNIKVLQHSELFGVIAEIDAKDFTVSTVVNTNDSTTDELTMRFTLTPCNILQLGHRAVLDVSKGYQRGVDPWSNEYHDETISIDMPWGAIELYRDILIRREANSPVQSIAEPAGISIIYKGESDSIELVWDRVEMIVRDLLKLLSFVDGQRVDWVKTDARVRKGGLITLLIEQYQAVPRYEYAVNPSPDHNLIRTLRTQFCRNIEYFLTLDEKVKTAIHKAIDVYLLASGSGVPTDAEILLLQSSIEVLVSHFKVEVEKTLAGAGKKPKTSNHWSASERIIALSDVLATDLSKYYGQTVLDEVRKARGLLPFVALRNAIVHDGGYPEGMSETEAKKECQIMNVVFRRMIYSIITKFGKPLEGFKITTGLS